MLVLHDILNSLNSTLASHDASIPSSILVVAVPLPGYLATLADADPGQRHFENWRSAVLLTSSHLSSILIHHVLHLTHIQRHAYSTRVPLIVDF